jgi:hypothetical protein
LLPLLTGRSAIGIAYHEKTVDLMRYVGLPAFCLDVDPFEPREVRRQLPALRLALDREYGTVARLVRSRGGDFGLDRPALARDSVGGEGRTEHDELPCVVSGGRGQ